MNNNIEVFRDTLGRINSDNKLKAETEKEAPQPPLCRRIQ